LIEITKNMYKIRKPNKNYKTKYCIKIFIYSFLIHSLHSLLFNKLWTRLVQLRVMRLMIWVMCKKNVWYLWWPQNAALLQGWPQSWYPTSPLTHTLLRDSCTPNLSPHPRRFRRFSDKHEMPQHCLPDGSMPTLSLTEDSSTERGPPPFTTPTFLLNLSQCFSFVEGLRVQLSQVGHDTLAYLAMELH
jgi:hypothetical protein